MAWTVTESTEFLKLVKAGNKDFKERTSSLKDLFAELKKTPLPTAAIIRQKVEAIPLKKRDQYRLALKYLKRHYPGLDERTIGGYKLIGFESIDHAEERRQRAIDGIQMTYRLAKQCEVALSKVQVDAPMTKPSAQWSKEENKATDQFKKWFDQSRRDAYRNTARAIFTRLRTALEGNNFEIVVYGTPEEKDIAGRGWHIKLDGSSNGIENAFAFVIKDEDAYRIYMASAFFKETDTKVGMARPIKGQVARDEEEWQSQKKAKTALDAAVITTLHELTHIRAIGDTDDVEPGPYDVSVCKRKARENAQAAITNAENYALFAKDLLMDELFRIDTPTTR